MEAAQEAARSEARTVAEAEVIIVCVRGAAWAEWAEWLPAYSVKIIIEETGGDKNSTSGDGDREEDADKYKYKYKHILLADRFNQV